MALTKQDVLRAWKDEDFRNGLSPEDRAAVPARPTNADGSDLTDEQLEQAAGGTTPGCVVASVASVGFSVSEIVD
jgi:mersacidin/lichenicidin family type 2 lantibiotic